MLRGYCMISTHHDISLLFENVVLLLMKQTGNDQELLIRALLRSKLYYGLLTGETDITMISPEEAAAQFVAEEVLR